MRSVPAGLEQHRLVRRRRPPRRPTDRTHAGGQHRAASSNGPRAPRSASGSGSGSDRVSAAWPHVLSKCTLTSKNNRLSEASPEMCHGVGPDRWPSRCTEASTSVPCRRSMPADRSNMNENGSRSHSASNPSQPCTLKPPVPAVSSDARAELQRVRRERDVGLRLDLCDARADRDARAA